LSALLSDLAQVIESPQSSAEEWPARTKVA
jgi:hypothetical protein